MRKWWVGLIFLVIYAFTIADHVPFWVSFVLFWVGVYYFTTGQKADKPNNSKNQIFRIPDKPQSMSFDPGNAITCNVAGVTFENRQKVISALSIGADVFIIRDRANVYDENAIEVFCYYGERKSIGYIPKEISGHIAKYFDYFTTDQFPCRGKIVDLSYPTDGIIGVKITFRVPDEKTLEDERAFEYFSNNLPF